MDQTYNPEHIARRFAELKLRGVAEAFEERYHAALAEGTGILEFVAGLLDEEAVGRKQRRFERLLKAGNLDPADSIENYDDTLARSRGVDPAQVRDLIGCAFIDRPKNIVLAGAVGTGKTKLARTLAFEAARRDYKAFFENTRELVETLFQAKDSYVFPKLYRKYVNADLLCLDDLAYMPFAPEKVDFLFRLVFDRTEKKTGPVIVTTNTDVKEWWQFFPSKAMGMTFSDRILGGAIGIKFTGASIRREGEKHAD